MEEVNMAEVDSESSRGGGEVRAKLGPRARCKHPLRTHQGRDRGPRALCRRTVRIDRRRDRVVPLRLFAQPPSWRRHAIRQLDAWPSVSFASDINALAQRWRWRLEVLPTAERVHLRACPPHSTPQAVHRTTARVDCIASQHRVARHSLTRSDPRVLYSSVMYTHH